MDSEDTEITLGVGKLLGLFFLLAAICGVFFSIGYSLGHSSGREQVLNDQTAGATAGTPASSGENKPSAVVPVKAADEPQPQSSSADSQSNLTFYKAVQKNDASAPANGKQSSASAAKTAKAAANGDSATELKTSDAPPAVAATSAPADVKHPGPPAGSGTFVVQIAALTHEDDAAALAGALRKKSYNVFVVNNPAINDKFYHVQVGPFASLQEANAMKDKLSAEGYSPIVKR